MKINTEVLSILRRNNIPEEDAIPVLLSFYLSYYPKWIPKDLISRLNTTRIYGVDDTDGSLVWNYTLFEIKEVEKKDENWDWVKKEYVELFRPFGKAGHVRESILRMKKLFSEYPHIRKEDVLGATQVYLQSVDDLKYCRSPHYFISKGVGSNKIQDILTWLETYKVLQEANVDRVASRKLR